MPTRYPPITPNPYYQHLQPATQGMGRAMPIPAVPQELLQPRTIPTQPTQYPNPYQDTLRQYGESNTPPSVAIKQRLEIERMQAIAARNQQFKTIDAKSPEEKSMMRISNDPETKLIWKAYEQWKEDQPRIQGSMNMNNSNSAFGPPLFESDAYAPMLAAAGDRGSMHPNSQPLSTTYSGMKRA